MGWLNKLFNLESPNKNAGKIDAHLAPKEEACNRLKLVLMHDRTQLSPGILESMRDEMLAVIKKYVEVDDGALDLHLESESNTIALVANIPVLRSRT